jgi:hypothetical protein
MTRQCPTGLLEMDRARLPWVWWCGRLSVCTACLIRQGAVKARLFLVHRHCASLGTNEPRLACNCHSAGGASRHDWHGVMRPSPVSRLSAALYSPFFSLQRHFSHAGFKVGFNVIRCEQPANTPVITTAFAMPAAGRPLFLLAHTASSGGTHETVTQSDGQVTSWSQRPNHVGLLVPSRGQVLGTNLPRLFSWAPPVPRYTHRSAVKRPVACRISIHWSRFVAAAGIQQPTSFIGKSECLRRWRRGD